MSTKALTGSPRERLLAAANELFYDEGIHTVGIDRVIERAGVAKASLYSAFGSKDELVRAYLSARFAARQKRIEARIARHEDPRERLLAVFDMLGDLIAEQEYRGCAMIRASAESRGGEIVRRVCDDARAWTRALFTDLAREARAAHPERLAKQLVLLYDGAAVTAQMDRDAGAAGSARAAAAALIDVATARKTRCG
jgi:AcrR family transcriptional regulator